MNVARAKQLLAENSRGTSVEFRLALVPDPGSEHGRVTHAVVGMANAAGVQVTVKTIPQAHVLRDMTNSAKITPPWHANISSPTFASGSAGHRLELHNLGHWQVDYPTFLNLAGEVMATVNGSQRLQFFAEIEERRADLTILINAYCPKEIDDHKNALRRTIFATISSTPVTGRSSW